MLLRLTPDQVSEKWPMLSQCILNSFEYMPEATPQSNTILEMLMELRLQCWVNIPEPGKSPNAVLTTTEVQNTPYKTRSLLVFSLWASMVGEGRTAWEEGMETLKEYASEKGLSDIIMYTRNPSVKVFLGRRAKHKDFFYLKVS